MSCGGMANWDAPDGALLKFRMNLCGDDLEALADTVAANLDAVAAEGQQALVIFNQGTNLPRSWLAACETYTLDSGNFNGDLCLPWDEAYQQSLASALHDRLGPAISGHSALAGVYFTITTMTNGAEMHFRVERDAFPYPGDDIFRQSYLDVLDLFQEAFAAPIMFEAGHCIWMGEVDCDTPRALYEHSRDTYGVDNTGIALWNCAERFWVDDSQDEAAGTRDLIELATLDGASIGCQTVGSFTNGACRFTHPDVGDYGPSGRLGQQDNCPEDPAFDPEGACVDTMRWFAGVESQASSTAMVEGTWAENWSADYDLGGIATTSQTCRDAIDLVAP